MLKTTIFIASVILSLSFKENPDPPVQLIPDQTILVQTPRILQNIGLGDKTSLYSLNASQEVHFSRLVGACFQLNDYYSFRALSLLNDTFSEEQNIPIECLTKQNNYDQLPVLRDFPKKKTADELRNQFSEQFFRC